MFTDDIVGYIINRNKLIKEVHMLDKTQRFPDGDRNAHKNENEHILTLKE